MCPTPICDFGSRPVTHNAATSYASRHGSVLRKTNKVDSRISLLGGFLVCTQSFYKDEVSYTALYKHVRESSANYTARSTNDVDVKRWQDTQIDASLEAYN